MPEARMATFAAVILASGGADKLATKVGAPHKATIDLNGTPMINFVADALTQCPELDKVVVVAHPSGALPHLRLDIPVVTPDGDTFVDAIQAGADACSECDYILICTCDAPMLTAEAVSHFVQTCHNSPGADLAFAIVKASVAKQDFPEMKRTTIKLVEGEFSSGCLGAMTRRFIDNNMDRLREVFELRKSKIALGNLLGWQFVVKLILRKLSLVSIVKRAEHIIGCQALVVISPFAGVAFDVDKQSDLQIAQQWAANRSD